MVGMVGMILTETQNLPYVNCAKNSAVFLLINLITKFVDEVSLRNSWC